MPILYALILLLGSLTVANQALADSEMEARKSILGSAQEAFLQGDFSKLEDMSRNYRTTRGRTPSGLWKLTLFYAGIGAGIGAVTNATEQEEAFRQLEATTLRWAQQYPDSPSPHIVLSIVHIEHAWAYRGNGYAYTVKPEAWAPFRNYISLARQNLEAHKSVAAADPRWYETMLSVAIAEGWERVEFDSLLNEALDREPAFYQTYFTALEYLLPKWYGGAKEIEEFAQEAVRRTSKQEGRGMYARIYWFASQAQFQNELFTESFAAWQNMKEGFEDVIAQYPDTWNLNNYAKFACLAHDREKTRELLKRIESTIVIEAWMRPSLLQQCSDWALRE